MTAEISIGRRRVGDHQPAFIVAEAGVNHKGSLERAQQMIWEAAGARADAIKFQSYKAQTLVTRSAPRYWQDDEPSGTQYAIFRRSDSFGEAQFAALYEECQRAQIIFLSTPFDLRFVDFLDELGMPAFKVASADLTNHPMLRRIAQKHKPVILSTGAATLQEVEQAVQVIQGEGNDRIALLHCILSYPTAHDKIHLRRIPTLAQAFPRCLVGLSDHTIPENSAVVPVAAVALGACIIEKHYTLNRTWPGDDHYLSVDSCQLAAMVRSIRLVEAALGSPKWGEALDVEQAARQCARRSIVAAVHIPAGTRVQPEMLIMKRPGSGIPPSQLEQVVGRTAKVDIPEDTPLDWQMIE